MLYCYHFSQVRSFFSLREKAIIIRSSYTMPRSKSKKPAKATEKKNKKTKAAAKKSLPKKKMAVKKDSAKSRTKKAANSSVTTTKKSTSAKSSYKKSSRRQKHLPGLVASSSSSSDGTSSNRSPASTSHSEPELSDSSASSSAASELCVPVSTPLSRSARARLAALKKPELEDLCRANRVQGFSALPKGVLVDLVACCAERGVVSAKCPQCGTGKLAWKTDWKGGVRCLGFFARGIMNRCEGPHPEEGVDRLKLKKFVEYEQGSRALKKELKKAKEEKEDNKRRNEETQRQMRSSFMWGGFGGGGFARYNNYDDFSDDLY